MEVRTFSTHTVLVAPGVSFCPSAPALPETVLHETIELCPPSAQTRHCDLSFKYDFCHNKKRFQNDFSDWTFRLVCLALRNCGVSPETPAYVSLIQRQLPSFEPITPVPDEVFSLRSTSLFAKRQRAPHQLTAPVLPPLSSLKVTVSLGVSITLCVFVCLTYPQL